MAPRARAGWSWRRRPELRGYEDCADLPEDASWRVYAVEEIAVEKLVALANEVRNEPRDLYDLSYLECKGLIDLSTLLPELDQAPSG